MNKDDIGVFLNRISLFTDSNEEYCRKISADGHYKYYEPGDILSSQNASNSLYLVLSGQLTALKDKTKKRALREVINYTQGNFFEGLHLIRSRRVDYIKVKEKAELLILDRVTLDEVVVSFLRKLSFFENLPKEQLQVIASEVHLECYNAGDTLFNQGDPPDALYIVESGEIAMLHYLENKEDEPIVEEEIASYGRGGSFGERGVLGDLPRAGRAVVRERTSLLVLPADRFQAVITKYPEVAFGLYRYLANQLEKHLQAYRRSTREVDKMKELIQSTKMAALGQLVAGVAHEINTPVGSISSNGYQLQDILAEVRDLHENLPQVFTEFYDNTNLQTIANELGMELTGQAEVLFNEFATRQLHHIQEYYGENDMDLLLQDMTDISGELSEASNRIRDMVKSLATFARLDEAELKKVSLHEGLDSTLSLLHHELKYKIDVERDYQLQPEIVCHPNQLNQVFMNILMNAIQALEVDKLPPDKNGLIRVATYQKEGWAVVAISDNGKGIPAEKRSKIFEPFFSTKGAAAAAGGLGLGLGLSISKKIVEEKHLGKLKLDPDSQEGWSTTFLIELPLDRLALIPPD